MNQWFGRQGRQKHPGRAPKRKKRISNNENSLRKFLDNMKSNNIYFMAEKDSEQGIENLFEEIMTETFPILVKENDTKVQKVWRAPNETDLKKPSPRHIIF